MSRNNTAAQEKPVISGTLFEVGLHMKDKLGPLPNAELLDRIAHMGESVVRLARKKYYLKETARDLDDMFKLLGSSTVEESKVISATDIAMPMGRLDLQRTEGEDLSETLRIQIGGVNQGHESADTVLDLTRAKDKDGWQVQVSSKTDGTPSSPVPLDENLSEAEIIAVYGFTTASAYVLEDLHANEKLEVKPEPLPQ